MPTDYTTIIIIMLYYVITDKALCVDILCTVQQCTIYVTLYLL